MQLKPLAKLIIATVLVGMGACVMTKTFTVVPTGSRGVKTYFGKVIGQPLPEGLYFFNPITTDIVKLNVQEQKWEDTTICYTQDTQTVTIKYAVTYYPTPGSIHTIYQQFGSDWYNKIIPQVVLGSIKDIVGKVNANDLVNQRDKTKNDAEQELKEKLLARGVVITRLDFVNMDFNDEYEKAIEAKVVAAQNAERAKNVTIQIEEQAKQTVMTAKAEAEAMKIKTEALSQNKGLVQYEAVQKWNGSLPTYMFGSTIPMINLDQIKGQ